VGGGYSPFPPSLPTGATSKAPIEREDMAQTKREGGTMLRIRFVCPGPALEIPRELGMTAKELLQKLREGDNSSSSFLVVQSGEEDTERERERGRERETWRAY